MTGRFCKSVFLVVTLLSLAAPAARAAVINVPADYATIQAAIDAAVDNDEIVVAPGTYNETINFLGKAITVRSTGGAAVTTIDGTGFTDSVVKCCSGEGPDTVLEGFTITGGRTSFGGGMHNARSSPTITNCTFTGNSASASGGGMYNLRSNPTVTNCSFSGNTAGVGGGMVNWNNSSPTLTNCTFSGNSAGDGGGMLNFGGSPTVTNCTFSGNSAGDGGGMLNLVTSPTVTNCILWANSPNQIGDLFGSVTTVSYSDVQGGWFGAGSNNINADPLFLDADGLDDIPGTEDDNLRLLTVSPAIDAADNTAVPPDSADLDGDGDTTERTPLDLDGNPRFVDDPATPDSGNGTPPIVDMGAYEFHYCGDGFVETGEECDDGGESATCDADCTVAECGDGTVNVTASEECDDGNTESGDGCDEACQVRGACCESLGGTCLDRVRPDSCQGTHSSFHLGVDCDALDPECAAAFGACCRNDLDHPGGIRNCTSVTLNECRCPSCRWFKRRLCEDVIADELCAPDFFPIPATSEWGLVILTLLLVTCGKIYFGRRSSTSRS